MDFTVRLMAAIIAGDRIPNCISGARGNAPPGSTRARPLLPDENALLDIGRRSPRADSASAGWECL